MSRETQGPPGWLDKMKFIEFYFLNGCETSLFIYLRTGGEALTNAVLSLLLFDMLDLVRGLFRPKGLRGTAHGSRAKKNKGKGKATEAIPELAEIIADEIKGETGLRPPNYSEGAKALWMVDNVTQRGLYFVMIADVIADFAFDWYSGIISDPGSDCELGRGQVYSNREIVAGPGWGQLVLNEIRFEKSPCIPLFTEFQLGPGQWFVTLAGKVSIVDPIYPNQQCQLGLIGDPFAFEILGTSDRRTVTHGDVIPLIAECHVTGPINVRFYEYTEVGGLNFDELLATAFQIGE